MKGIAKRLARLIVGLWIESIAMAIISVGFVSVPWYIGLVERLHDGFIPSDWTESVMAYAFYHYSPLWYLLSIVAIGVIVMVKGIRFLQGGVGNENRG